MVRLFQQMLVIVLLATMMTAIHYFAKLVVNEGYGIFAIAVMLLSLPTLSRYLD